MAVAGLNNWRFFIGAVSDVMQTTKDVLSSSSDEETENAGVRIATAAAGVTATKSAHIHGIVHVMWPLLEMALGYGYLTRLYSASVVANGSCWVLRINSSLLTVELPRITYSENLLLKGHRGTGDYLGYYRDEGSRRLRACEAGKHTRRKGASGNRLAPPVLASR